MKPLDLIGQKFGRLTVVAKGGKDRTQNLMWICECECGNRTEVRGHSLKSGQTRSCGCLWHDTVGRKFAYASVTHGYSGTPIYMVWTAIKERCQNPNCPGYKNYGGRGISVCDRWDTFENFLKDMGKRPSPEHSIDRIDNEGNYSPENCRWTTRKTQLRNKRTNHYITFNGQTKPLIQWAEEIGINPGTLSSRLRTLSWSVERALTTPVK